MPAALTEGAHHIGLTVAKLAESAAFFTPVLGWKEVRRNDDYPARERLKQAGAKIEFAPEALIACCASPAGISFGIKMLECAIQFSICPVDRLK